MSDARRPAARVATMEMSPIRAISEGAPADAIPLGLGVPGWPMAASGWRALAGSGICTYTPHAGLPELRDAIAASHGVDRDWVVVTCGAEGALTSLYTAWLDPGDRILVPDPGFPAYPAIARLVDAEPVPYPLAEDRAFRLDVDIVLESMDRHRPRAVQLALPSNPTGGAVSIDDLRRLVEICEEREVLLFSDEAYRQLYLGEPPPGVFDVGGTAVAIGSASKAWAASGLRVGWAVGHPDLVKPARIVQGYQVIGSARPAQEAVLAMMAEADAVLAESRRQLALRWEALSAAVAEHLPGVNAEPPDGGFYWWLRLPGPGLDDPFAFCVRVRDEGRVVLIPGLAFGAAGRRHARLSFAADPELIAEGIRRMAPYWS